MKDQLNIICFGKNGEILDTVLRLINAKEGWQAIGFMEREELEENCKDGIFDLLLLGGGIDEDDETSIKQFVNKELPNLKIVQHFGGGSGLLYNEIIAAMSNEAQWQDFSSN